MKPIPNEMRQRIIDDCNSGMTEVAAAEKWKVSPSFITKLKRRVRDTGTIEPKKGKTGPKPKLEAHRELLEKIVADTPDATLFEIRDALPVEVTHQTVANELYKLKLAYKKTTESRRAASTGRRRKTGGVESHATRFGPEKTGIYR